MMDALTEHRLGSDLAVRMEAISLVFQGMSHWQRSYINDIEGQRTEAVACYEDAQTAVTVLQTKGINSTKRFSRPLVYPLQVGVEG